MARKRFTAEQIIIKLREAEVELAKGQPPAEVCRKLGVTEQTFYRWKKQYVGLEVDQVRQLKQLHRSRIFLAHFRSNIGSSSPSPKPQPAARKLVIGGVNLVPSGSVSVR